MADGPPRSPPKSPSKSPFKSPKKPVTRYGPIKQADLKFGTEERFQWQNAASTSDVMYQIPEFEPSKSVIFSNSLRKGMDDENPDAKKRSTGPGSYDYSGCFDHISEYALHGANRFGQAPRQSMAMKTPSPGAVYNIESVYWNGPDKHNGVGFSNSTRQPLYGSALGANADMFFAKPESGPAISIAKRLKVKGVGASSPGAIYDVHVSDARNSTFIRPKQIFVMSLHLFRHIPVFVFILFLFLYLVCLIVLHIFVLFPCCRKRLTFVPVQHTPSARAADRASSKSASCQRSSTTETGRK